MGSITRGMFSPQAYGEVIAELLDEPRLAPLGPGKPNEKMRSRLETLYLTAAFAPNSIIDESMARACLAGLWLYHDFLDESHEISQEINTPTGNYWHGLLHRREPDASNAAYWFRRVGEHAVFGTLAKQAQDLGLQLRSDCWNPFDFIDLCEKHRGTDSDHELLLRRVQQREWELLFDWCFRGTAP